MCVCVCVCVCVCNGWLSYVLCRICYASVIPLTDKLKNISCNSTIEIKFQVQVPHTHTCPPVLGVRLPGRVMPRSVGEVPIIPFLRKRGREEKG